MRMALDNDVCNIVIVRIGHYAAACTLAEVVAGGSYWVPLCKTGYFVQHNGGRCQKKDIQSSYGICFPLLISSLVDTQFWVLCSAAKKIGL